MAGTRSGWQSVFRGKNLKRRYQGVLTNAGAKQFEEARRKLAGLVGVARDKVSDGDTIEFLARGEAQTRAYLQQQQ